MGKRPVRSKLSVKNLMYMGVPREYHKIGIEEFQGDSIRIPVERYINNIDTMLRDKVNLVFFGANGTGKTLLSSIIIRECYRQRYTAYRITLQGFIDMQFRKNEEGIREKINKMKRCEFLVIDEVGKESHFKEQFNVVVLEELLRERDTLGHPTIICTNLPLSKNGGMYEVYGNSIMSLVEGNFLQLEFSGDDLRFDYTSEKSGIDIIMGG